jgi:hypothetical protein
MGSASSLAEVPLWRYPYWSQPVRWRSEIDHDRRISSAVGS